MGGVKGDFGMWGWWARRQVALKVGGEVNGDGGGLGGRADSVGLRVGWMGCWRRDKYGGWGYCASE